MKKTIRFTEAELEIIIGNEKEGDGGWYGYEAGTDFDDLTVEFSINDLCNLSNETFLALKNWLVHNAAIHIKAAVQERNELQQRRDNARHEKDKQEREQRKLNKGNKVGFVYLVGADNGLHKIGKSVNVTNRVTEFGIKLPVKTWLVHSFQSNQYDKVELQLHEMFADKRSHGEWFNLTPEDIEYFCSIQDGQL